MNGSDKPLSKAVSAFTLQMAKHLGDCADDRAKALLFLTLGEMLEDCGVFRFDDKTGTWCIINTVTFNGTRPPKFYSQARPNLPKGIRQHVLSRDNSHCRSCGRSPAQTGTLPHIHHLKAYAYNGHSNDPNEYACLCPDCNHTAETGNLSIISLASPKWRKILEGADKEAVLTREQRQAKLKQLGLA
jgi:5-methylcytosine-specific restriction endonuclease McrA